MCVHECQIHSKRLTSALYCCYFTFYSSSKNSKKMISIPFYLAWFLSLFSYCSFSCSFCLYVVYTSAMMFKFFRVFRFMNFIGLSIWSFDELAFSDPISLFKFRRNFLALLMQILVVRTSRQDIRIKNFHFAIFFSKIRNSLKKFPNKNSVYITGRGVSDQKVNRGSEFCLTTKTTVLLNPVNSPKTQILTKNWTS